ncbi:MAG: TIGR03936 family radical SAM-associated protein [Planctomycetota bacterium]
MRKFTFQVRFSKDGRARFLPHRELMTLIERAVRRADIPIALSEGFNPRPRISFLGALSLGIPSDDEVIYLHLAEWLSPAEVQNRLNPQLASLFVSDSIDENRQLIRITEVSPQHSSDNPKEFSVEYHISGSSSKASLYSGSLSVTNYCQVSSAVTHYVRTADGLPRYPDYSVGVSNGGGDFPAEYHGKINSLLGQKEIMAIRKSSEGQKSVDIRPYIKDAKIEDNKIILTTKVTNQGTARPDEIIEALGLQEAFAAGSLSIRKTRTIFQ